MLNTNHNSNVQLFSFENKEIRTVIINGEPWWIAKDVCELLGYKDHTTAVRSHCRGVQKLHPIIDSLGRAQEARIVSEPDLLRLIVGSTLPEAVKFEQWIFEVILPQIRKTGAYISEIPAADTTLNPHKLSVGEGQKIIRAIFLSIVYPPVCVIRTDKEKGVILYSILDDYINYENMYDDLSLPMQRVCDSYGRLLKNNGIRVEFATIKMPTMVFISNSMPSIKRFLKGTGYSKCWSRVLEVLPGTLSKDSMRFSGCQTRAVGVPLKVISDLLAMPIQHDSPAIDDDKAILTSSVSEPVTSSRGLKTIHLKIISRVDKPVKLVLNIV